MGAIGEVVTAPVAPALSMIWLFVMPPNCCENGVVNVDLSLEVCETAADIQEFAPLCALPPCVLSLPPLDVGALVVYCCAEPPAPPLLPCDFDPLVLEK